MCNALSLAIWYSLSGGACMAVGEAGMRGADNLSDLGHCRRSRSPFI
jgi:hypothetical protein